MKTKTIKKTLNTSKPTPGTPIAVILHLDDTGFGNVNRT